MLDSACQDLLSEVSRVEERIRNAFRGVILDDGIGLLEAQALDDYAGPELQAAARAKDEKNEWSRIPADLLNSAHSSLSYFDPQGMQFHLPAFMIAELTGMLDQDFVFRLATEYPVAGSHFSLLTTDQRHAVREFLLIHLVMLDEPSFEFEYPMIEQAIAAWSPQP